MAKKKLILTFSADGTEIKAELEGYPPGASTEKEADKYLKGIAVKDKVGHRPHKHTKEGQVVYTG